MKSYPYIGRDNYNKICLMLSSSYALTMDGYSFTHTPMQEGGYTSITPEYLQNTYGEVVSPEHAEFIIELAKVNGIECTYKNESKQCNSFTVSNGELSIYLAGVGQLYTGGLKLITIPLPPKQMQTATPEEEFEMEHIMKNAGDNLVLGCEDSKCDEWPKIDDEVTHPVFGLCKVISPTDSRGVVALLSEDGFNVLAFKSDLVKPKTPEEELRDDLFNCKNPNLDTLQAEDLSEWLIANYEMKKKPQ